MTGADAGESKARPRRRSAGFLSSRWADERELTDAIHGLVVGSGVMVAASLHGTLGQVVVAVVATLLVYWVAERYAEVLAEGVHGRALNRRRIGQALRRGWPMLQSSYAPVVVLLVTSALGAELPGAVLSALGLSTALLAGIGYDAARRSGTPVGASLLWAGGTALLGVAVIVLKLALH
ncbi:hypothetical protein GCM10009609_39080 [Pseudonocardia aurantiaca]|uniref:VIT family protein n=1 Tax=Pseudonocardia aurantiaca TaxID=75290 RepID=A0ABW4FJT1_9PSEU